MRLRCLGFRPLGDCQVDRIPVAERVLVSLQSQGFGFGLNFGGCRIFFDKSEMDRVPLIRSERSAKLLPIELLQSVHRDFL